jgi:hypothetical protein
MSDIEGKVTRVGTSERGERTSVNYEVKAEPRSSSVAVARVCLVRRLPRGCSHTLISIGPKSGKDADAAAL